MIGQRTCRRNTDETRIVMLNILKKLYSLSPDLRNRILTGHLFFHAGTSLTEWTCQIWTPADILEADYPLLIKKEVQPNEN